ncbi:MAG: gliding motility protein GldC [Flavobacteriales bacterium]|nr:gliding motility protein GldC [Flavobacteriales bacterium]MCB9335296.1 gliding motility protein GldC [Flavobacteriales bacterium]
MKKSEINFKITLDENHVPENIEWEATDSGEDGLKECKALMMSLWDKNETNTMRIDIWTKEMMIDEMQHFFYQSIMTMSDTYERATNDKEIAKEMREFAQKMGEKIQSRN